MYPLKYNFDLLTFNEKTAITLCKKNNNLFERLDELLKKLNKNSKPYKELSCAIDFIKEKMGGNLILSTKTKSTKKGENKEYALLDYKKSIIFFSVENVKTLKDEYLKENYFINSTNYKKVISKEDYQNLTNGKSNYVSFFSLIENAFSYGNFRELFYKILHTLNINVCSYCLNQYAIIYKGKNSWKMTAQLDHLSPKAEYPLLSVCINNLFPVCGHCNNRKGQQIIDYNPLGDEIYNWNFKDLIKYENGKLIADTKENFKIERKVKLKKNKDKLDLVDTLEYNDLYKHFAPYISDFVNRLNKYGSEGYKKSKKNMFSDKIQEDKLLYFLTDTSLKEEDIFKYPLTKLKIELYKEMKAKSNPKPKTK